MATKDDNALFIDTNILVYANVATAPLHEQALRAIEEVYQAGRSLWISRQVLREFIAARTRPQTFAQPSTPEVIIERVRYLGERFQVADDTARFLYANLVLSITFLSVFCPYAMYSAEEISSKVKTGTSSSQSNFISLHKASMPSFVFAKVIAKKADHALHVLDRFHVMAQLGKAIDQVRAEEARKLKRESYEPILSSTHWLFLKRPGNLTAKQASKLAVLLRYNLKTVRSYLLKEEFQRFWCRGIGSESFWMGGPRACRGAVCEDDALKD